MSDADVLNQFARQWLAETHPELHLIRATLTGDRMVCSVLSHYDGVNNGKRHPAIIVHGVRWFR